MQKHFILLLSLLLCLPQLASAETLYVQALAEKVALLQAQLASLQSPSGGGQIGEEWKFNYSKANVKLGIEKEDIEFDEDDLFNNFLVRNNRLYEDNKWTKDRSTDDYKMWNVFAEIAGEDFVDEHIDQYATYRVADTGVLGFVELVSSDEPQWGLAVNAKAANFSSEKWVRDLASVMIHEYAHILTLNRDQLSHNIKRAPSCKVTYLSSRGCSTKKSYINAFVNKFWNKEDLAYTGSYEAYYKTHPNDFITKYAPKSPEEDIAESFTQFILYEKPTGTKKKDLKVAFFYEYPELVELRTRIREAVEQYYTN